MSVKEREQEEFIINNYKLYIFEFDKSIFFVFPALKPLFMAEEGYITPTLNIFM